MPVQINEMIIRANIMEADKKEAEVKDHVSANVNKDEIIKECTELILEILGKKNER